MPSVSGVERKEARRRVEKLLEAPCWVVDVMPMQVPADAEGQFFKVEQLLLRDARKKFANVLLTLNCYHDLQVLRCGKKKVVENPKPKKLEGWTLKNTRALNVLVPDENALLVLPTDSTYMALYNPSHELLRLVKRVATVHGLFVWWPQ